VLSFPEHGIGSKVNSMNGPGIGDGTCIEPPQGPTLYINGKFVAQSMTGVQRVAHETVLALDRLMALADRDTRCVLLCPPGGTVPQFRRIEVRVVRGVAGGLAAWEQLSLPWASRDGLLLNFAGSSPWIAAARSICLIHDAAVFDQPCTYTRAFRTWYRFLFRRLASRAVALATVSEFSRQRLAAALHVPPERLQVIHNGADHFSRVAPDVSVLPAYGLVPRRFVLVVGTEKRTKNIHALLEAWRAMPRAAGEVLVWVGGQNLRVFSASRAQQRQRDDAADGVVRIGVVPDARLKALYQAAAALVIPSTYEGFGFPAVEAMSCGCPVLAAEAAALPEVCGDAALYFRSDDLGGAAAQMRRLLDDAGLRETLSARGVARAHRFSWDATARSVAGQLSVLTPRYLFAR
jgi:glycosyltransferase involved in cell wall biosynthesis